MLPSELLGLSSLGKLMVLIRPQVGRTNGRSEKLLKPFFVVVRPGRGADEFHKLVTG